MADRWPDYEPRYARPAYSNNNIEAAAREDPQRYQPQPQLPRLPQLQQPQLYQQPLHRETPPPTAQKDHNCRDTADRCQPSPLSRMSRLSRLSRVSLGSRYSRLPQTADCVAVECFLRVASAILASAVIAASAVLYVLLENSPRQQTATTVDRINWVIGIPIGGMALTWQLARLGILAATLRDDCDTDADCQPTRSILLAADITVESLLAVGGVICSVLAAFQAARHSGEREGGCDVALSVLIALLAIASFGVLAVSLVNENRRRSAAPAGEKQLQQIQLKQKKQKQKKERRRFRHSSNSSVIEIIRR